MMTTMVPMDDKTSITSLSVGELRSLMEVNTKKTPDDVATYIVDSRATLDAVNKTLDSMQKEVGENKEAIAVLDERQDKTEQRVKKLEENACGLSVRQMTRNVFNRHEDTVSELEKTMHLLVFGAVKSKNGPGKKLQINEVGAAVDKVLEGARFTLNWRGRGKTLLLLRLFPEENYLSFKLFSEQSLKMFADMGVWVGRSMAPSVLTVINNARAFGFEVLKKRGENESKPRVHRGCLYFGNIPVTSMYLIPHEREVWSDLIEKMEGFLKDKPYSVPPSKEPLYGIPSELIALFFRARYDLSDGDAV